MKKKTQSQFVDELAREMGYPYIKLNYHQYLEVLKKARQLFINQ